jgi:hypothetical protein
MEDAEADEKTVMQTGKERDSGWKRQHEWV